jgi:hypothetical protein
LLKNHFHLLVRIRAEDEIENVQTQTLRDCLRIHVYGQGDGDPDGS